MKPVRAPFHLIKLMCAEHGIDLQIYGIFFPLSLSWFITLSIFR